MANDRKITAHILCALFSLKLISPPGRYREGRLQVKII